MTTYWRLVLAVVWVSAVSACTPGVTEFCLDGEFDLGARYQGTRPQAGEFYPLTWCVITEDNSPRVVFSASGKSNPDIDDEWTVAYLPPDMVRILNRDSPPDIEFHGTDNAAEAKRVRSMDPRRLREDNEMGSVEAREVWSFNTSTELPLRGAVPVVWRWDWANPQKPKLQLLLDGVLLFKATGRWRDLPAGEAATVWQATPGHEPVVVPGDRWPAQVNMQVNELADDVYLVSGVRTGFRHLVVDTEEGLVVADAPAGWVEFHHIPPSDLVPGLGVSGLSEQLIDFLYQRFPGRPIRAVALTHFHDDHAGGARAFAAAGAEVYATQASAEFFATALNRSSMPADRLTQLGNPIRISPVSDAVTIGGASNGVRLLSMGPGPHAYAMLGVWAIDKNYFFVSDVHVPRSDAEAPPENRAVTECWFARWAVDNLTPEVRVVNSHSAIVTPVARLARYLDSDPCADGGS